MLGQYDEQSTGRAFSQSHMTPFNVTFDSFRAVYLPTGEPKSYDAVVTYTSSPGAKPKHYDIRENHPLVLGGSFLTGGTKVYLGGHGFAPHLIVTRPARQAGLRRERRAAAGGDDQLPVRRATPRSPTCRTRSSWFAIHGIFAPSHAKAADGHMISDFPAARNPELQVNALSGDPSATRSTTCRRT